MQQQINELSREVSSLTALQKANHEQNQKEIHRLNNAQQDLLDTLTIGLEKIADKIGGRIDIIQTEVVSLKVQFARMIGYATGMAALAVGVAELAKFIIERIVK